MSRKAWGRRACLAAGRWWGWGRPRLHLARACHCTRGSELLDILAKPTARESARVEQFRTAGGSAIREHCPHLTKDDCRRCAAVPFHVGSAGQSTKAAVGEAWAADGARMYENCRAASVGANRGSHPEVLFWMQRRCLQHLTPVSVRSVDVWWRGPKTAVRKALRRTCARCCVQGQQRSRGVPPAALRAHHPQPHGRVAGKLQLPGHVQVGGGQGAAGAGLRDTARWRRKTQQEYEQQHGGGRPIQPTPAQMYRQTQAPLPPSHVRVPCPPTPGTCTRASTCTTSPTPSPTCRGSRARRRWRGCGPAYPSAWAGRGVVRRTLVAQRGRDTGQGARRTHFCGGVKCRSVQP